MSKSAPTSPKNFRCDVNVKSSALPLESNCSQASPRKSRNTTLTNFLKKLSPKLRHAKPSGTHGDGGGGGGRKKTWYVVEIDESSINESRNDERLASTSGFDIDASSSSSSRRTSIRALPPPDDGVDDQSAGVVTLVTTTSGSKTKSSESERRYEEFSNQKQSDEELLGTQTQQRQPLIRINDTDCSPTQKAGSRVRRTQQPPKTLNILNKIIVHQPSSKDQRTAITSKMASIDSIGSCSLDIDATASESSGTADGGASSISQRTLHSVSVDFSSLSTRHSKSGHRLLRSPNTFDCGSNNDDNDIEEVRYVSELYIPNGGCSHGVRDDNHDDDKVGHHHHHRGRSLVNQDQQPQRKPSYIGISCSVSGYTSYSCYGSKTSRDNSPARLAFTSNTSNISPALAAIVNATNNGDSIEFQSDSKHEDTVEEENTSSVTMNTNCLPDVVDCSFNTSENGKISRRSVYRDRFSSYSDDSLLEMVSVKRFGPTSNEFIQECNNGTGSSKVKPEADAETDDEDTDDYDRHLLDPNKSLIQQRIERLYGPGALAQGFRLQRMYKQTSMKTLNGTSSTTLMKSSSSKSITELRSSTSTESHLNSSRSPRNTPAVFRHLRPNFADQLTTTNVTSPPKYIPIQRKNPASTFQNSLKPTIHEQQVEEILVSDHISSMPNGNHTNSDAGASFSIDNPEQIQMNESASEYNKDAHWFILTMNSERDKIKILITRAEGYLTSGSLPEDACGRLRAAIGKANLLLTQKFLQFRGLCEKNLIQNADEPFPTTISDLAGFWDMVLIQVQDIHKIFEAIERMRERGWIVDEKEEISKSSNGTTSNSSISGIKPKRVASTSSANTSGIATLKSQQRSTKADEAARARMEARKRLLEAKRKGRLQASAGDKNATSTDTIEIYVPENRE